MALIAALIGSIPNADAMVSDVSEKACWGTSATSPMVVMLPDAGTRWPAIRRSSVVLPAPLAPISEYTARGTENESSSNTDVPSGHLYETSDSVMDGARSTDDGVDMNNSERLVGAYGVGSTRSR